MSFSNPNLEWEDIPRHNELVLQPVQPGYRNILFIERLILWLLISVGLAVAVIRVPFAQKATWAMVAFAFSVSLIAILLFTASKAYRNMGFALRKHDIVFRKGWLFEKLHIVPLKKIQHCELKRGPLERNYGLASLKIYTAGGVGADITLGGLKLGDAEQLKDWLVRDMGNNMRNEIETPSNVTGME